MRIFFSRTHESRNAGRRRARLRRDDGFTLFEVLIAAVVLIVGLTTLFGLLDTSVKATASTRAREGATNVAREILEDARTIPYAQLSPSTIEGELQAMNGLADASSASGWQIVRRGYTYTVTVSECSIDDPKNGYGVHDSTFCSDSSTTGTEDPQPANLKRITVDVKWSAQGRAPDVHEVETLTAAGEAVGLTASELQLTSPEVSTAPVIEAAVSELQFSVTAPAATAAMSWSLEGVRQTPAPTLKSGSTTTWIFSWKIPVSEVSDGTYQVSAQAITATGVNGPPVSISVTLIRSTPAKPKGINGGFNKVNVAGVPTQVAELQWLANSERNVIGYRVINPSGQRVCPASESTLSLALSCIDLAPPEPSAPNRTYSVVALYRKAEGKKLSATVSQGPTETFPLAGGPPPAPNVPTGPLTATKNADGSVTLNWSVPKSGGPAVSFYRIYRGSTDYTSRYDVTSSGATTTYTDTSAATTHNYWVTAVSSTLTESPFLGPVTG